MLFYRNIRNIDISYVAVRQMQDVNKEERPLMLFEQMDVLDMSYRDGQFTVVLDKGTLDALMPNDSPESSARIDKLFQVGLLAMSWHGRKKGAGLMLYGNVQDQ